jgi:hypothetical protein
MNRQELKAYLEAQLREIEKYKWTESQKAKRDIGFNRAALEWIERYGESFHDQWLSRARQKIA